MFYLCLLSAPLRSNGAVLFYLCLLSAPLRSNGADYVLPLFIFYLLSAALRQPIMFCYGLFFYLFFYFFFIHRSFSETTRPILTKFSGIVYSDVV